MKNFLQRLGKLSLQQRALFESRLLQMRSRGDAAVSGVSGGSESCPQRREKQVRCAAPRNPYMHFEPEEVEQSIAARFEQQARRWANRVAVKTAHHELTYAALNRAANQLAHFLLQERGNGAEPVGLLIEHGAPMVIALLAVLKAGKFYVPLDPAFPRERLAYILDDAQVGIVLTSDALIGTASELAGPHRRILSVDAVASGYSIENPELPTAPEAFAYLLYTSGSTGEAKGVVENHRNVLHFTMVRTNSAHIAADDRLAMLLSFSFSGSATPLYCALLNGAALHLRYLKETGAADLARWLAAEQITVCITSVSAFRQLVSTLNGSEQFPRLRLLRVGAEPVYRRDVELFRKYFPASCLLLNSIGSTEMKNFAEYFIDHDTVIEDDLVPVGYPVEDTEILLLDDDGQAVGLGEIGEIVVKTRFIAPSYWRRPELTQTTFQPAPGGGDERLYRTGDLGRQRPDGALVHLGRKDFQVKIRGYRIEIGEIENALLALPDVSAAVVVARENEPGDRRLVAYVVLSRGAGPRIGAWRAALAAKLPDYMIPASFVILESLPLTSTGKVDRAKLPQPDRDRPVLETPYKEPDSQLEKVLATLWAEVLGLHRVGMNDDFSTLGGDSLRGASLLTNVKAVFGVDLPFERLLKDAATLAGMARAIEEVRSRATPDKGPTYGSHGTRPTSIPHRQESEAAHLSDTQRRMWFHASLNPDDATYNESRAYRLIGDVDVEALDRSVRYMARRHEILRTTYSLVDDEPRQIVHEDLAIELKCAELGAVPKKQRSQAVERLLLGEMQRAFDLEAGAPLRILLLRLSEREAVLLRVIHHIASDGWSSGIIEREISAAYNAFVKGREPQLPALPIQYADYATWQREWLQGEALEGQLAYWKAQLANLPTLELPTDRPRPPMLSYRGTRAAFDLPASLMQGLKTLGQREGATLFMTLLAAFHVLLSRYSGQEDVAVGTPIAGRGRIKLERLIGFFANTLVLRSDLSGNPRFRELLARVRETALGAYTHQDLPFEKLVEELDPARDMSRNPLFQVMFALQNAPAATLALDGVEVSRLPLKGNTARFDLTLSVHESADGLHASWEYATDLFDAATIQRLGGHFTTLLEAIVADPEQRIGELPLLNAAERHQLLVQWNDTAADYPRDRCIHQLFEAQAARTPERTALRVGTTVLSYAELDTLATRIAQALRAQGVGRGQRVGLCVERGADMLAAMLGILKAGAAYVPLDPAFPQERLRFMARDAELTLLLSTAALAEPFGLPRERQLLLDTDAAALASHSDQRLTPDAALDAHPEDPAYVIYTSGSTGTPKGVVVPHRSVVNFLTSMAREPGFTADDVLVAVTTLSFDIAVLELQLPLTVGATVVIAGGDEAMDGQALKGLLEAHGATVMQATPVTWRLLLEAGWTGKVPFKVLVGGEALPKDLADELLARGVELWNLYGPTETTVWSTCARITDTSNGISIGRPIANTAVYVLDAHQNLCPIGVPGELCIGGTGVTPGYWKRPELTAERFIPDPFGNAAGARLYRTGDRARWLSDGTLEHLGRLDDQVKVRGFRVELGEIEAALAEHPGVRQAAVHLWMVNPDDARIVACCVPVRAGALAPVSLRRHLRARLPEYMIPQHFLPVKEIPLTPNGKVDRRRLPTPVATESAIGRHEAPADPVEVTIAAIWTTLLQPARAIGRNDRFFEMGGHSFLALRALRQMEQALGVRLHFRVLLHESLADIATRCRSEGIAS